MSSRKENTLINLFLLFSMAGFIDALYLSYAHFSGGQAGCFLVEGCDVVLSSPYSEILGVPVALLGLLYYLFIFVGFLIYNFKRRKRTLKFLAVLTTIGLLATLWFLYLQVFVLNAFCSYCLVSAGTSIALFIMGMYSLSTIKSNKLLVNNINNNE